MHWQQNNIDIKNLLGELSICALRDRRSQNRQQCGLHFDPAVFFEGSFAEMRLFALVRLPLTQLPWGQEGVPDSLCNPHDTVCVEVWFNLQSMLSCASLI
jgi:hypothetical protein